MQVANFNKMTIGERDELLYYGILYVSQQLAGILTHLERISRGPGSPGQRPN
jgi:hypothetical protein